VPGILSLPDLNTRVARTHRGAHEAIGHVGPRLGNRWPGSDLVHRSWASLTRYSRAAGAQAYALIAIAEALRDIRDGRKRR
jgi:hypothetical protein